ncbi:type II secretion system minor pseudopilin GspJ [Idiomarina sp.]|uniref:type II secretion system minor pseudopilin GspJ n=1 Tax=Idiomarina sp. TaxID=1874361 RepID=UPI001D29B1AF|nr:type II secretion system minor pseudopilin GspJ [Idiomarina sp.]MCJ8316870.1 type II secretion system minor pseudopilin GspJ [Idiomarina sp.]NQZ16561.1 type II secretion system minor pseudopilin GspJ [Idiomarina sp.]
MHVNSNRQLGFTLVEVLVTMAIFAVIGIASYQVLSQMVSTEQQSSERRESLEQLQFSQLLMQQDIRQLVAKPTRPNDTEVTHQYLSNDVGYFDSERGVLAFVRSGFDNPGDVLPRAELQPVIYRVMDGQLQRVSYSFVNDRGNEPTVQTLLSGVTDLSFRFYRAAGQSDGNRGLDKGWNAEWRSEGDLPKAIEVTLQTEQYGEIKRIFLVAGAGQAEAQSSGGSNAD